MRSFADAIIIMPVAEHSISTRYFRVLRKPSLLQISGREQDREQRRFQNHGRDEHAEPVDRIFIGR